MTPMSDVAKSEAESKKIAAKIEALCSDAHRRRCQDPSDFKKRHMASMPVGVLKTRLQETSFDSHRHSRGKQILHGLGCPPQLAITQKGPIRLIFIYYYFCTTPGVVAHSCKRATCVACIGGLGADGNTPLTMVAPD